MGRARKEAQALEEKNEFSRFIADGDVAVGKLWRREGEGTEWRIGIGDPDKGSQEISLTYDQLYTLRSVLLAFQELGE